MSASIKIASLFSWYGKRHCASISTLELAIERNVAERPLAWQFFFLTGAPFRAYHFKISRRSAYWVVYDVDEEQEAIDVLRVWHSAQNPDEFEL